MALGADQIAWVTRDLKARSASTPIVVFAHMPLWTIYEPWGWGTGDADRAFAALKRFGSVTVLNGHIHQIVSKVECNITFHTARSTAYPQPTAGNGPGPMPLTVASDQLPRMLGVTSIKIMHHPLKATLDDTTAMTQPTPMKTGPNTITIDNAQPTSYVLVWITTLGTHDGKSETAISDITLKPTS